MERGEIAAILARVARESRELEAASRNDSPNSDERARPPNKRGAVILPGSFYDSGDEALVGHFAEADTGHFEFAEVASDAAGELAAVAEADSRRIAREFV